MPRKSKVKPAPEPPRSESVNVPLRMDAELAKKLKDTAATLKINQQTTARMSLDRGLDVLLAQLTSPPLESRA